MSITSDIDRFCNYFAEQLEVIKKIDVDPNSLSGGQGAYQQVRLYRKALIVTGLDSLAAIRFPKENYPALSRNNRQRFTRFIEEFTDWEEGSFVSVPFLADKLTKVHREKSALGTHLSERLSQFSSHDGDTPPISRLDQPIEDLLHLAETEKEEEAISEYQHYSLLYRYRNYLVHESREPGAGMEFDSLVNEPYYHGYINSDKWFLVYPMHFFNRLYETAILEFQDYLTEKSINPYDYVSDTDRW